MPNEVKVDTSSFNKFARDLRRLNPIVAKDLGKNLKVAGEIVAADARSRLSSKKVKIKVRRAGLTVRVAAVDGKNPGEARALENKGREGTFRHPVYGHKDRWTDQKADPFLKPALEAHRHEAVTAAKRALNEAFREVGFH